MISFHDVNWRFMLKFLPFLVAVVEGLKRSLSGQEWLEGIEVLTVCLGYTAIRLFFNLEIQ